MGNTFEKLSGVLREQSEVLPELPQELKPELALVDDLHFDSLDVVKFVMSVEDRFNIEIPDEDAEKWKTLGDIAAYLEEKGVA